MRNFTNSSLTYPQGGRRGEAEEIRCRIAIIMANFDNSISSFWCILFLEFVKIKLFEKIWAQI